MTPPRASAPKQGDLASPGLVGYPPAPAGSSSAPRDPRHRGPAISSSDCPCCAGPWRDDTIPTRPGDGSTMAPPEGQDARRGIVKSGRSRAGRSRQRGNRPARHPHDPDPHGPDRGSGRSPNPTESERRWPAAVRKIRKKLGGPARRLILGIGPDHCRYFTPPPPMDPYDAWRRGEPGQSPPPPADRGGPAPARSRAAVLDPRAGLQSADRRAPGDDPERDRPDLSPAGS